MSGDRDLPRSICQFPISLAVEGPDCFKRMADMGVRTVIFCDVIYAPYRLVLPRYPDRAIYSLEEGRYYHAVDASRYADLPVTPLRSSDFADRDLLDELVQGAHAAGLKAGVWLTLFANGHIAKQHPDWAVQNIYGSRDRLFLDYDHPQVRDYSIRVATEIAQRYDIDELMLDKIPQTCLEATAFGGRVEPIFRTMGTFCFSDHTMACAKRRGLDLASLKPRAKKLADQSLAIPPHVINALADDLTGDHQIPLLMLDHPWVGDVLRDRIASIVEFLADLRQSLDQVRKDVTLSAAFVPPVKLGHDASSPRPWLAAQSYAAYAQSALDLIHCVIHWDPAVVEYDTRRAVDAVAGSDTKICTHIKAYGSTGPDDLAPLTEAVMRGGAHGLAYFCYDLMSQPLIDAAVQLAR